MSQPTGSDQIDWGQLAAYFANELPPHAAARFEEWVGAEPRRAEELERLRVVWHEAGHPPHDWKPAQALQALKEMAQARGIAPAGTLRVSRHSGAHRHFHVPSTGWWMPAVAAGLLLLAGGALWYLPSRGPRERPTPRLAELVTPRGQRAELSLPDGSRVILGPGSRLQYSADDFATRRELQLEGEAYFEVVHDPDRPLKVFTSRGVTEDLGTAFAVVDHREGPMRVVVAEGRVVLRVPPAQRPGQQRDSLVLEPRDLGQLDHDGRLQQRHNVDVESYLAWREGRLVFRGTPLREVLFQLATWYDIDIELGDSALAQRPFTASFRHETPEQVLNVLSVALRVRYERRGALLLVLPVRSGPVVQP